MESRLQKNLADLSERFASSSTPLPLPIKMRTAEIILRLMMRRKGFGMFVILGWQAKWRKHLDISDSRQDLFAGEGIDVMRMKPDAHLRNDVAATADFDGAILIDRRGVIVHSGAMIEGMRPSVVAQKINPGRYADLSEQFGFAEKVHTRHLSAIAASYVFKGTTVFTVSEENGDFHVFEAGKIVCHY
ncbi:MAG TPA: hypothetical protein VLC10_03205 [Patescibacteria group bacterium]|nr:hypothetical protein [Patescibacteria group bacterium]